MNMPQERANYDEVDYANSRSANSIQRKWLSQCIKLALRSELTHKHGCVIVNRKTDEVISQGFNYNSKNHHCVTSMHAETAAIKNAKKRMIRNECDMYVVRLRKSNNNREFGYSKPCPTCTREILSKTKITHIYYSINQTNF
jgi:deoxycytidylate deaminase